MIVRSQPGGLTLIVMVLQMGGCRADGAAIGAVRVSESDSAGVALIRIAGPVQDLPVWELPAEPVTEISGNEPPFLGSVGEVEILSDGGLLVEDNQTAELRRFSSAGEEVLTLGVRGDGPGEFQNLTELTVTPGDTAYAYDRRLYRISRFEPDGSLGATVNIGRERAGPGSLVLDGWAVDSEHLLLHSLGPGDNRMEGSAYRDQRDAVLHLLDGDGNELGPPLHFTGGYSVRGSHGDIGSPFANEPFVSVGGGRILHGSGLKYELNISAPTLEPIRVIRWEGWEQPLTDDLVRAVRDTMESGFEELRAARPDLVTTVLEALFNPDLLPDTLPALSSALLDDTGRIWVSKFRSTTDVWSEQDAWHVLDPDGTPLARLQLPSASRLADVRGNRVALIVRDELDVEHVRVFELSTSRTAR